MKQRKKKLITAMEKVLDLWEPVCYNTKHGHHRSVRCNAIKVGVEQVIPLFAKAIAEGMKL